MTQSDTLTNNPSIASADPVRAALYARVSCEQQAQKQTIDSQVAALRQRMAEQGHEPDEQLCFLDDGYSGSTLLRPGLERLRDAAAAGLVDRLYLLCPDRLARTCAHQMVLLEELAACGVTVVFLNHETGDSPEDRLLLQMQGMIAEYERAKIIERCRRGRLHAARRGSLSVMSRAPYGYRYVGRDAGGGQARFDVRLEEAAIVRQIFQWIAIERLSLHEVSRRLRQQGTPAPRGGRWDHSTVWGILHNPAYKGSAAFGRTRSLPPEGGLSPRPRRGQAPWPKRRRRQQKMPPEQWVSLPVPPIVEEPVFAAVAGQLEENRRRNRLRRAGANYLLQGLLVCRHCGYALCGHRERRGTRLHRYYRCTGSQAHSMGGQRICPATRVRADLLEQAVWQDVAELLKDPQRVREEYERRLHQPKDQGQADDAATARRQLQRAVERLIDAYEQGLLDKEQFEPRIRSAKAKLSALEAAAQEQAQEEESARELRLVIEHLEAFARRVGESLQQADESTKREIVRTLVKVVELDQQQVKVIYRVGALPFADAPSRGSWQYCWRRAPDPLRTRFLRDASEPAPPQPRVPRPLTPTPTPATRPVFHFPPA
jgi:site-specific DNA recombinase